MSRLRWWPVDNPADSTRRKGVPRRRKDLDATSGLATNRRRLARKVFVPPQVGG